MFRGGLGVFLHKKKLTTAEQAAQVMMVISVPLISLFLGVMVVSTRFWMGVEYGQVSFPDDSYGFTNRDRVDLAEQSRQFVLGKTPPPYRLMLNGDMVVLSNREVKHMTDVRLVMAWFRITGLFLVLGFFCGWSVLYQNKRLRKRVLPLVSLGGVMSLSLLTVAVMIVTTSWDAFFQAFHAVLFTKDSWLFLEDAVIIRLFPERFWVDAAVSVLAVSSFLSLLVSVIPGANKLLER